MRRFWRREAALAALELCAATLLLHLFARAPEQIASAIAWFLAGIAASAWLAHRRLAERGRASRFLVAPLVTRALGWTVAAVPFAGGSPFVLFLAAYFGFLSGGLRAVAYRMALDDTLGDLSDEERGRHLRATLFERLVLSSDALGLIAANALVLFVLSFMGFADEQVRRALLFAPFFAAPTLAARWALTRRLVRAALVGDRVRTRLRRLPALLAAAHLATWLLVATVASAVGADDLRLDRDDQFVIISLAALLVWGILLYQMRWHRTLLARLEPHLPGPPAAPARIRTLRRRMLLMFGFPILFACALSTFAAAVQYRRLATQLIELEAAALAEDVARRLEAAHERGGDAEMAALMRSLRPSRGTVVLARRRGQEYRAGQAAADTFALPGTRPPVVALESEDARALRTGRRTVVHLDRPLMAGAIRPLPGTPSPGGVAVLMPGYRARGRFRQLLGLLFFSLALAAVAVGVVARGSGELAQPVRALGESADSIASGHLDARVAPVASPAELAQLSESLEQMRHALVDKIGTIDALRRDLEKRVEERTGELRAANRELAEVVERTGHAHGQLVHAEKMASLGQLVAGIAHEINNPLNFVLNTLAPLDTSLTDVEQVLDAHEALDRADGDEARARAAAALRRVEKEADLPTLRADLDKMLGVIRTGVERTMKIVAGLRAFARAQGGEAALYDVDHGLDEALLLVGSALRGADVELVRERAPLPLVRCRGGEITQVFFALLHNAAQSGARRVVVRTRREERVVAVEVADDGAGIPEDRLGRIFDPFFTTRPVGHGAGLGLSISLGIVRAHGGTIDVTSRVGQGSTFVVRLPLDAAPTVPG